MIVPLLSLFVSPFRFVLSSRRNTALKRLRETCLRSIPGSRASDWIEFQTSGIVDNTPCPFRWRRADPHGTFFLCCDRRPECEIVAMVERALRDIGLDPGIASAHTWRASRYQIPITGAWPATEAEVWFNTAKHDDRVILVAVSLTDS